MGSTIFTLPPEMADPPPLKKIWCPCMTWRWLQFTSTREHDFTSCRPRGAPDPMYLLMLDVNYFSDLNGGKHVHLTPYCHILINLKNCDKR
jgi:hypothetical protein